MDGDILVDGGVNLVCNLSLGRDELVVVGCVFSDGHVEGIGLRDKSDEGASGISVGRIVGGCF